MRRAALLTLASLFLSPSTQSQETAETDRPDAPLGVVDTVTVEGNTKTETYVILNEMTLKAGSVVTREAIAFDRNRIYSLGLFTRVDIWYDSSFSPRTLRVIVGERWHIIPLLLFGFRDGDPKKVYFGAGVLHNNLRGRNQKLYASFTLGYNPSFAFAYQDPLLDHDHHLFFSTGLGIERVRNRSVVEAEQTGDYDERHYGVSAGIGKRFSLYTTARVLAGYTVVAIDDYRPGRTVSADGKDMFPQLTLAFTLDSRDLVEYALTGTYVDAYATLNGLWLSTVEFARFGGDIRHYHRITDMVTIATRVHGSMVAGGMVPVYAQSYFGYTERIRGEYETVLQGENIMGGTVEARFMVLKPRVLNLDFLPIPSEFAFFRYGIGVALFADVGTVWDRGDRITLTSFVSGYGGSLDLLLPYSFSVRLAYAWNEYRRGQFILDLRKAI